MPSGRDFRRSMAGIIISIGRNYARSLHATCIIRLSSPTFHRDVVDQGLFVSVITLLATLYVLCLLAPMNAGMPVKGIFPENVR